MKLYRFLSGPDNSSFCHKISAAIDKGWELYGSPVYAYDQTHGEMRCGQAVTKTVPDTAYSPDMKLGEQ